MTFRQCELRRICAIRSDLLLNFEDVCSPSYQIHDLNPLSCLFCPSLYNGFLWSGTEPVSDLNLGVRCYIVVDIKLT